MPISDRLRTIITLSFFQLAAIAIAPPVRAAAETGPPAIERSFEVAQWAFLSSAGRALQKLSHRAASGSPELAGLVRMRQDLIERIAALDHKIAQTPTGSTETVLIRGEIESVRAEIASIDERLERDFPRYAELANPTPLTIEAVQALLAEGESLLFVLTGADWVHIWAINKTDAIWHRANIPSFFLAEEIAKLRSELDPNAGTRGARSLTEPDGRVRIAPFSRQTAHFLYTMLIQPVEPILGSSGHVLVVADGALSGLPLSLLVSESPMGADTDPQAMRETAWLARRFAFTTLPSVESLAAIRSFAQRKPPGERIALMGFGAPVLGGKEITAVAAAAPDGSFFRGTLADVDAVRNLPSLPQTGPELRRLADSLSSPQTALFLGDEATEKTVRNAALEHVDVLAFATHGLLSGELPGLAEPALVLTPPDIATPEDDGLLTASEIAELRLSADWVLLSACNTAGSDGRPDAEGLSGLARAFLYAGARAILVSHWPVRDDAAARLTTNAIGALADGTVKGRSEALRRAMLDLMNDGSDASLAHPAAWAPFVIVGEGA